jgi:6-phosphofructokinase
MITKEEKKRIMKFITYYRGLKTKKHGELKELISNECGFRGGTFYYKLEHENYDKLQIAAIERVVENYKVNGIKKS